MGFKHLSGIEFSPRIGMGSDYVSINMFLGVKNHMKFALPFEQSIARILLLLLLFGVTSYADKPAYKGFRDLIHYHVAE